VIGVVGAALLPLALHQRKSMYDFPGPLLKRAAQVPKQFMIGFNGPYENVLGLIAVALVLVALIAVARAWFRGKIAERVVPLLVVVTASSVAIPVGLTVLGRDYLNTRNVIA